MATSMPSPVAAAGAAAAAAAERRPPRVAVVGAGFAGLAAALTLQRSGGCEVTVLEASSRPGGRACTQKLAGGSALELGATWFHGLGTEQAPNPVFKHAVEMGLIGPDPEAETWWSSQFLLPGTADPLSKEQQVAVAHALAAWTAEVEGLPNDARGTTADHLRAAWARLAGSGKVEGAHRGEAAARAWRWREHLQRAMDGCDSTSQQSALGLALYDEMPGGVHCPLPAGMQAVAEGLAVQLTDLRYNHAVERISWGGPGGGVSINCTNGVTCEVDAAIVTVSLGVLKAQHERLFEPALPPAKAAAIRRLRCGVVDKVFLDFERPPAAAEEAASASAAAAAEAEAEAEAAAEPGPLQVANGSGAKGSSQAEEAEEAEQAAAAPTGGSEPAVSYALLWSCPWEGFSSSKSGGEGVNGKGADSALAAVLPAKGAAAEAQVPEWLKGVFSLRFGGPEMKQLLQLTGGTTSGSSRSRASPHGGAAQQQEVAAKEEAAYADPTTPAAKAAQGAEAAAAEDAEREVAEDGDAEFSPCAEAAQPTCYQAVAWITGEAAAAMEAASDEEVLAGMRQLAAVFPQLQLPPGASWDSVKLHRSGWGADPFFRGSYSYLGPDCSPADVAALAAPIYSPGGSSGSASTAPPSSSGEGGSSTGSEGDSEGGSRGSEGGELSSHPLLLFAGEACHVVYIGTMQAAYLTGQCEAERLLRHWGRQEQQQD